MPKLRFEWDRKKAAVNKSKHGVSLSEARAAFYDDAARLIDDPDHSETEPRRILLGMTFARRVVIIHHKYRESGIQDH